MSDLAGLFTSIEGGEFPPTDLGVTRLAAPAPGTAAVLGFTAHTVIAADLDPPWLDSRLPPGDPGAAFNPPFLGVLENHLSLRVNNIDILTLAPFRSGSPQISLKQIHDHTHPRVRRALRYRDSVQIWACDGGILIVGRGLGGRWEAAVEVEPANRGHGLGRALAEAATHLVPDGRPIWAEIGVGNAASVRAFLAAGYQPVGQEALLVAR